MPRTSKFDRDRMNKLFGDRTKLIHKEDQEKMYMKPTKIMTPPSRFGDGQNIKSLELHPKKEQENCRAFKSFSYVSMKKVFTVPHRGELTQKIDFRCFNDLQIFGDDYIDFLKKNHDQDHDTPPEQAHYDVSVGIKRLKEGLQAYLNPDNDGASSVRSHGSKGLLRYESVPEKSMFSQKEE